MKILPQIIIISLTVFISCWKKQDHEILAPRTPVYEVSGSVINSLTNEPMEQVKLTLIGIVKYNDEDSMRTLVHKQYTNEDGSFNFIDVPGAFTYILSAEKDSFQTTVKRLVTYYQDKDLGQIVLGKFLTKVDSANLDDIKISGITHQDDNLWLADSLHQRLIELSDDLTTINFVIRVPFFPSGLAWDGQNFWSSDAHNDSLVKFQKIEYEDSIRILAKFPSPNNIYHPNLNIDLTDISWSDDDIWACSKQIPVQYFYFNPEKIDSVTYLNTPLNMYRPAGISVDKNIIYLACKYYPETRLYLIEKETNQIIGYAIIPGDTGLISVHDNDVWLVKNNYIKRYEL